MPPGGIHPIRRRTANQRDDQK